MMKQTICALLSLFLFMFHSGASAPVDSTGVLHFSKPSWPEVAGPLSFADRILNNSFISRSRGIYSLRKKVLEVFTPTFDITSSQIGTTRALNPAFFSYALGSHMYEDASRLLFAEGLFHPSDTLDYLRGLVCYDIHDFSLAYEYFRKIPSDSPYSVLAKSFLDVWENSPEADYHKNPKIAAVMSAIIPGSGKIYAGDVASGLSSFLIVGALGGMFADSWNKKGLDNWRTIALGSILGLFYTADIYGSYLSVSIIKDSLNDAQKTTLLFNLRIPLHSF